MHLRPYFVFPESLVVSKDGLNPESSDDSSTDYIVLMLLLSFAAYSRLKNALLDGGGIPNIGGFPQFLKLFRVA